MNSSLAVAGLIAFASVLTAAAVPQNYDPVLGAWKLNVTKSTFRPGPAPKSSTLQIERKDRGVTVTMTGVAANSGAIASSFTASYDGRNYPITGSATADSVRLRRVDALTVERIDSKAGKFVQTVTRVLSGDGKTLTVTTHGTNAQGETVHNVAVYERPSDR